MSYAVMDRYGGMAITYDHIRCCSENRFSGAGTWWPDFGPTRTDFNDAGTNHPTSTIFHNSFEKYGDQKALDARLLGTTMPITDKSRQAAKDESGNRQFRHPNPSTEAMMKSTIIQPYKKGGRLKKGLVGAWSRKEDEQAQKILIGAGQASALFQGQTLSVPSNISKGQTLSDLTGDPNGLASGKTIANATLNRSLSAPSVGLVQKRPVADSDADSIGSSVLESLPAEASNALPQWVASRTFATRPTDAAGHAKSRLRTMAVSNKRSQVSQNPETAAMRTLGQALPHHADVMQTLRSGNTLVGGQTMRLGSRADRDLDLG